MTDPRILSSINGESLFVCFHLVGDMTYKTQKNSLEKELNEFFPQGTTLEHEDPEGINERELVFKIRKPDLQNDTEVINFFKNLKEIFASNHRYLPSFTQSSEVAQ